MFSSTGREKMCLRTQDMIKMKKVFVLPKNHPETTRVIQFCKNCGFKCKVDKVVFGCERMMASVPLTTISGITFDRCCVKRILFDKNYVPVGFWREPTKEEWDSVSLQYCLEHPNFWDEKMDAELEELKNKHTKELVGLEKGEPF